MKCLKSDENSCVLCAEFLKQEKIIKLPIKISTKEPNISVMPLGRKYAKQSPKRSESIVTKKEETKKEIEVKEENLVPC